MRQMYFLVLAGLLSGLSGCRRGPEIPPLVPVTGTLKIDGKPAPDVEVFFNPIDGTRGVGSLGQTDANGAFTLMYVRGGAGASPGEYKVTLSKRRPPAPGEATKQSGPTILPPRKYERLAETPLKKTVPPGGGTIDIDVKIER